MCLVGVLYKGVQCQGRPEEGRDPIDLDLDSCGPSEWVLGIDVDSLQYIRNAYS